MLSLKTLASIGLTANQSKTLLDIESLLGFLLFPSHDTNPYSFFLETLSVKSHSHETLSRDLLLGNPTYDDRTLELETWSLVMGG